MTNNDNTHDPKLDLEFEQIIPWNGQKDTGKDVREKWFRNFERIKNALTLLLGMDADAIVCGEHKFSIGSDGHLKHTSDTLFFDGNIIASGSVIAHEIGDGDGADNPNFISVDAFMSPTSTNPVQNKVIYAVLGNLSSLNTINKESLVEAINEIAAEKAGIDSVSFWNLLAGNTSEQINLSHLKDALSGYAKSSDIPRDNKDLANGAQYITISALVEYATQKWVEDKKYITKKDINGKVDKIPGKGLSTHDYTDADQKKLDGIEDGANKYIHPKSHPASMIQTDPEHQFVSATQITEWNNKLDRTVWDKAFYFEGECLRVKLNLIGDKELSAYGKGDTSPGGYPGLITIVDNLDSLLADAALSANQGRILKQMIENKVVDLSDYYNKAASDERYAKVSQIPTRTSQLTNDSGFIKNTANAFSYSNLSGKPSIPTNTNQLTNGAGYITISALYGYAKTSQIPTKTSQLTNDSGFIKNTANAFSYSNLSGKPSIPTNTNQLTNGAGYITISALYGYAKTSQIPTKVSQLSNDKGYLTSHQPLDDYVKRDGSNWTYNSNWADKMIGKSTRWVDVFGDLELLFTDYASNFGEDTLASATDILCIDRNDTFGTGGPTAYPVSLSEFCTNGSNQTIAGNKIFSGSVCVGDGLIFDGNTTAKIDADGYALDLGTDGGVTGDVNIGNIDAEINLNTSTNIKGNTTITGNLSVTGEVTSFSSNGKVISFLVDNATTNSITQAPTAAALKRVNDEKNDLAAKIKTIKTKLSSINPNSDLNAIRNTLIDIKNNL